MPATSPMHFERYGRTYQLRIDTAGDLAQILELDDSLWVATSAPICGLNCDREFLKLVDLDSNGRIRCDELRAAVRWLYKRLADRSRLAEGTDVVHLDALDREATESRRLRQTAEYVLEAIGAEERDRIALAQITDFEKGLSEQPINGDGVITPGVAGDEETAQFVRDVMSCTGGREDLTGRSGITAEQLERFLEQARAYLKWAAEGDLPADDSATEVMPLGKATPAAREAVEAIEGKVDAFFARCRIVRFDPVAAGHLAIAATPVRLDEEPHAESLNAILRRAPLAEPNPDGVLLLDGETNPLYAAALRKLREAAVRPTIGEDVRRLTEEAWQKVKQTLAPHRRWLAANPGPAVQGLGRERIRQCAERPHAERVRALLEADREAANRLAEARELRKLLLYHKHLLQLANNFVSFPDLYDPDRRAIFEMGSLVIDGRWFNFAVRVEDRPEHSKLTRTSRIFVMYVELARMDESDAVTVAVPATAGTIGNLCPGKRGIFYDTQGRHYDARVVQIIENPISFQEALLSPFVRLGRFVSGKIEAISGSAEKELEQRLGTVTTKVQAGVQEAVRRAPEAAEAAQAAPEQTAVAPAPAASAGRRDLLLGASVSIAALSSAFAFITKSLQGVSALTILLALGIGVLIVLLPTAIVAGVKLHRRDMSAILEGCGWAINARMRLNRRQRRQFTHREPYPAGATGTPRSRLAWRLMTLLLVAALAAVAAQVVRRWIAGGGAAP